MSGCARTCVLWLLGWAGAAAAFYVYLREFGFLEPGIYWASGGAGLCVTLAVGYIIGIITAARERSTLLEANIGTSPTDGKWVAVSGHIHALSPLRAPLSGATVVLYEYKISRVVRGQKGSSEVALYEGKALAPSTIATRQGTIRLLAVPALDVEAEALAHRDALANAERYIAATTFETSDTPKERRSKLEDEWTDDDGNYRRDKYYPPAYDASVDLNACRFHEKVIRQNEVICAFGLYSQQRGGLIPHTNWAKQMRIMRGDVQTVAGQLRSRMIKYAIGVIVFAAIAYGAVRLYEYHARKASQNAIMSAAAAPATCLRG